MEKLRVIVVGCTPLARNVIELCHAMVNVVGIINLDPELAIHKSNYDPLSDFRERDPHNFRMTKDINRDELWISQRQPDIIIQCGWSQIFSKKILSLPKLFCVGFHPSPLPVGRGAAVLNWVMIESKQNKNIVWGNSMFVMEEKTDTGDVLDFMPFIIEERDDINTCYNKVYNSSLKMLKRTLPLIESGNYIRREQDNSKATRFYKRTPSDGLIKFDWEDYEILNYVRALTHPYPGAFFSYKDSQIIIWEASKAFSEGDLFANECGQILAIESGRGINVQVKNGTIWIERISDMEGLEKWADEWAIENKIQIRHILT